jgi:hypothetical protein
MAKHYNDLKFKKFENKENESLEGYIIFNDTIEYI